MQRFSRILASIVVVVHLAAMTGSALSSFRAGLAIRAWTKPWEKVLGVHQTWPMFVTPPRATTWLAVRGEAPDGTWRALELLPPEPPPDEVIVVYSRPHKFVRNAHSAKRAYLRQAVVRWACREAEASGAPLERVAVARMGRPTPRARAHTDRPRTTWPVRTYEEEAWNCPD